MPIQTLSKSDIRAIGSCLVLNDARSVVKELIDNSLDAYANTISIEISANTIDVIQVKDNGSGVSGEDRRLLCKRGCTSKIRTIRDLEHLGGSSLGFRGEALASVASISDDVIVTTRIDGELVGSTSRFGPDGHTVSCSPASHPVGTTVRVQGFLRTIPVRRQTALKSASKTLSGIQRLLQTYAFARPNIRIFFKVLRAKADKYNWTYGPKPGSTTLLDAAAKLVGQAVASECEVRLWTSNHDGSASETYGIEAVIAKIDGDRINVGMKGHFISIDGRPLSSTQGVCRDIVKLYQTYYRNSVSASRSADCPIDAFLCVHLRCPAGSYDVNVEPAKDEVLFTDAKFVLSLFQDFFESVYGSLSEKTEKQKHRENQEIAITSQEQSFGLLLASKQGLPKDITKAASQRVPKPHATNHRDVVHQQAGLENRTPASNESYESCQEGIKSTPQSTPTTAIAKPQCNMYEFNEDDVSTMDCPSSPRISHNVLDDVELRKASVTNPWTIAKLNASVSPKMTPASKAASAGGNQQLMTPDADLGFTDLVATSHRRSFGSRVNLPSPARSSISRSPLYQNPGPPLRRRTPVRLNEEEDDIQSTQESAREASAQGYLTALHLWRNKKTNKLASPSPGGASKLVGEGGCVETRNEERNHDDKPNENEMQSVQLTDPAERGLQNLQLHSSLRKPFVSPFKTCQSLGGVHFPLKHAVTISFPSENLNVRQQPSGWSEPDRRSEGPGSHVHLPSLAPSHQHPMASPPRLQPFSALPSQSPSQTIHTPHPDLDHIMDFEHRKKVVNAQQRSQLKLRNRLVNQERLALPQRELTSSLQGSDSGLPSSGQFRKQIPPGQDVGYDSRDPQTPETSAGLRVLEPDRPSNQDHTHSASQKQSPHLNRYRAAKAALTRPKPSNSISHAHPHADHGPAIEDIGSSEQESLPHLPEDDPRACLIRHREASFSRGHTNGSPHDNTMAAVTGTCLKIKRTKTSSLPFETIHQKSATYNISMKPLTSFPSSHRLTTLIDELGKVDTYHKTGNNGYVAWDPNGMEVDMWQKKVEDLVRERYVARLPGDEEGLPANVRVNLTLMLRAHCATLA